MKDTSRVRRPSFQKLPYEIVGFEPLVKRCGCSGSAAPTAGNDSSVALKSAAVKSAWGSFRGYKLLAGSIPPAATYMEEDNGKPCAILALIL